MNVITIDDSSIAMPCRKGGLNVQPDEVHRFLPREDVSMLGPHPVSWRDQT